MSYRIALAAAAAVVSIATSSQAALYADFEPGFSIVTDTVSRPGEWRAMTVNTSLTTDQKSQGQQSLRVQGAGALYEFDNSPLAQVYEPYQTKLFQVDIRPADIQSGDRYEQSLGEVVIQGNVGGTTKAFGVRFYLGVTGVAEAAFTMANPYNPTDPTNMVVNSLARLDADSWYTYKVLMDYDLMKITHSLSDMNGDVLGQFTFNTQASFLYSVQLLAPNDRTAHYDSLYVGAVPEPSMAALAAAPAMGLLARRRRAGGK